MSDIIKKNIYDRSRFILLRAEGYSFERIAKMTGISKPTLLKWNREEIDKISKKVIDQEYKIAGELKNRSINKVKLVTRELQKAYDAAESKDLKKMSTSELISTIMKYEKLIRRVNQYKALDSMTEFVVNIVRVDAEEAMKKEKLQKERDIIYDEAFNMIGKEK
jgi:transposase